MKQLSHTMSYFSNNLTEYIGVLFCRRQFHQNPQKPAFLIVLTLHYQRKRLAWWGPEGKGEQESAPNSFRELSLHGESMHGQGRVEENEEHEKPGKGVSHGLWLNKQSLGNSEDRTNSIHFPDCRAHVLGNQSKERMEEQKRWEGRK